MSGITFTPDAINVALGQAHPVLPHLTYMAMLVEESGSFSGYVPHGVAALVKAAPALLEALDELLSAELTEIPPYEAGKAAQDAWADRRAAARNNARAVIAQATVTNEFNPNPARQIDDEIDPYLS